MSASVLFSRCFPVQGRMRMRVLAVVANLAQVGIVLAIFIELGLRLGGWVILGLFLLLLIALLNQIVVFFFAVNKVVHQPLVGPGKEPVKRRDYRVTYAMAPQPTVIIDEHPYSVLDLSENGMRFYIDCQEGLKKHFGGRISLLCGQSLSFQGTLVRRQKYEAIASFNQALDRSVLVKEGNMLKAIQ
jgi:hypothetical protein